MSLAITIESAHWREAEGLAVLAANALHGLPVWEWLVPEPLARRDILPACIRIIVDHAFAEGAVYVSADRRAVAVWWAIWPGVTRTPARYRAWVEEQPGRYRQRLRALEDAAAHRWPKTAPHHRLMALAVRPEYQKRGYGNALLDVSHCELDRRQRPAYLDAPSRTLVALFGRHGYVPMGPAVNPPDGAPLHWPMWRSPRPSPGPGPSGIHTTGTAGPSSQRPADPARAFRRAHKGS